MTDRKPLSDKMMRSLAHKSLNRFVAKKDPELLKILRYEDNFRAVVLGMSFVEILLTELLEKKLTLPDCLDWNRMQIAAKADLAAAMGIVGLPMQRFIRALGNLRNLFAHSIFYHIQKFDVDPIRSHVNNAQLDIFMDGMLEYVAGNFAEMPPARKMDANEQYIRGAIYVCYLILLGTLDKLNSEIEARQTMQNLQAALSSQVVTDATQDAAEPDPEPA